VSFRLFGVVDHALKVHYKDRFVSDKTTLVLLMPKLLLDSEITRRQCQSPL
jgi:hypothetical protein